jgi:two-component system OmpR family response regulator
MIQYPMGRSILIADDDPHIRQLLAFALRKAGLEVEESGDGEATLKAVAARPPHLLVLDINMPGMDGLEVCRRIRATSDMPILFLSSRDDEIDRVLGMELGADDYVVKPFSPREVVARINAILRRADGRQANAASVTLIRHGRLSLDLNGWKAAWEDRDVPLTATEFGILRTLAVNPAKVYSRDEIIDHLHGPGFAVTDRTIDSHVRNVRAKFGQAGAKDVIATRAGIGYSLGPCRGSALGD